MKTARAWQLRLRDLLTMSGSRPRPHIKRPIWIIILVSMVCLFLISAYVYPLRGSGACIFLSSRGCGIYAMEESTPSRELTDDEIYSRVVIREILNTPRLESKNPKMAFLFLTPGSLPFERLWDKFFKVICFLSPLCRCFLLCSFFLGPWYMVQHSPRLLFVI